MAAKDTHTHIRDNKPEENRTTCDNIQLSSSHEFSNSAILLAPQQEKNLVRKLDFHLMPLLFLIYVLQYLDKTSLSYSSIMGIVQSLKLEGQDYSWASSAFYFGYLVATWPLSLGFLKIPLAKYLGVFILLWAVVLACLAACTDAKSLIATRVLLGAFESIVTPGFSLLTSMWYKPSEHVTRHVIWFLGNPIASAVGGLIAFGIYHINGSFPSWKYLFIIFGAITFASGILFILCIPDSPMTARFLDSTQRQQVSCRVSQFQRTHHDGKWKSDQCWEAMKDPAIILICLYMFVSCVPNGGLGSFGAIVIDGFGFNVLDTLLLTIPGPVFSICFILISTFLVNRFPRSRTLVMSGCLWIGIGATLMIMKIPSSNKYGKLFGVYLVNSIAPGFPIVLSLIASNVSGLTKKSTANAMVFLSYCTGNIVGPQFFLAREVPGYKTAYETILICIALGLIIVYTLHGYYRWENTRRDKMEGIYIDPEIRNGRQGDLPEAILTSGQDVTDKNLRGFRYIF